MNSDLTSAIYMYRGIDEALNANIIRLHEIANEHWRNVPEVKLKMVNHILHTELPLEYINNLPDIVSEVTCELEQQGLFNKDEVYVSSKKNIIDLKFKPMFDTCAAILKVGDYQGHNGGLDDLIKDLKNLTSDNLRIMSESFRNEEQSLGRYFHKIENINFDKEKTFFNNIINACNDMVETGRAHIRGNDQAFYTNPLKTTVGNLLSTSGKLSLIQEVSLPLSFEELNDNGYFMGYYKNITIMSEIIKFTNESLKFFNKTKFPEDDIESLKSSLSTLNDKAISHIERISPVILKEVLPPPDIRGFGLA